METNKDSSSEINEGRAHRRTSLPFVSLTKASTDMTEVPANRRHTLVPSRSILKVSIDGSNTISIMPTSITREKRRVSFAPEVTLHKINYSRANEGKRHKKRNSLDSQQKDTAVTKLSTSQYIGKVYSTLDSKSMTTEEAGLRNRTGNSAISPLDNIEDPKPFIINEDTQTMEMSLELTQQILKQQEQMKEQNSVIVSEVDNLNSTQHSLRDLFDEVESELQNDANQQKHSEEVDMEITDTIQNIFANNHSNKDSSTLAQESQENDSAANLEATENSRKKHDQGANSEDKLTEPPIIQPENNSITGEEAKKTLEENDTHFMELTQPIENDNATMELTEIVKNSNQNVEFVPLIENDQQTMEMTQPIVNDLDINIPITNDFGLQIENNESLKKQLNTENDANLEINSEVKEVTEMAKYVIKESNTGYSNIANSENNLSTVIEVSEPPTSSNRSEELTNEIERSLNNEDKSQLAKDDENGSASNADTEFKPYESETNDESMDMEDTVNSSVNENKETSELEVSLVETEMVPLAEVTGDFTDYINETDSENSFANDSHVNIPLDIFLNDVNVQFFDNIGPTDNEIDSTLLLTASTNNSPTSYSSNSTSSTPSSISKSKSNLLDYIDACTNIPFYHYIMHLINQYRSSIKSISTMVNTFSNDLLESNPTAIREYYQQIDDVRNDLRTNYQAIATFTRKQSKSQNTRFVASLLEQLSMSYERSNEILEKELAAAIEWRRNILIERQKMIEKKMKLDEYNLKLNSLKDNWSSVNIEKIRKANKKLETYKEQNRLAREKVSDISKLITSRKASVKEKMLKKDQLLKDIKELRDKLKKCTVPSQQKLEEVKMQLHQLEKDKAIRLLDTKNMTILICEILEVNFSLLSDNTYKVTIAIKDLSLFDPFFSLATALISKYENMAKNIKIIDYIKLLKASWEEFVEIWKEFLKVYFLYYGSVNGGTFELTFNVPEKDKDSEPIKILVYGPIDSFVDYTNKIVVKIKSLNNDKDKFDTSLLENLRSSFNNKNSFINSLLLD